MLKINFVQWSITFYTTKVSFNLTAVEENSLGIYLGFDMLHIGTYEVPKTEMFGLIHLEVNDIKSFLP